MNKTAYCAKCQKDTDHSVKRDKNEEWLLECQNVVGGVSHPCLRFIKFPKTFTEADVDAHLVVHKEENS